MQILINNDLANMQFKTAHRVGGASRGEVFFRAIAALAVGQSLLITKAEWPYRNSPSSTRLPKRLTPPHSAYRTRTLLDETGWVVERVK